LRERYGVKQRAVELAMGYRAGGQVNRIEQGALHDLVRIQQYVEAMGGTLEVVARMPGREYWLWPDAEIVKNRS
jgi:hypothetical protein